MTVVFYAIFFFALTVFITWHTGKHADDKTMQKLMYAIALVLSFGGIALAVLFGAKQNDNYIFRYIGFVVIAAYYMLCGIILEAMLGGKKSNLHATRMPAIIAWCVSALLPAVLPILSVSATPDSGLLEEGATETERLHYMLFGEFMRKVFSQDKMAVYFTILIPLIVIPLIGALVSFVIPDRFFIWANAALMGVQCAGMLFVYTIVTKLNNAAASEAVDFSMGLGFHLAVIPMCLLCAALSVMTGFYTYDRERLTAQPVVPAENAS